MSSDSWTTKLKLYSLLMPLIITIMSYEATPDDLKTLDLLSSALASVMCVPLEMLER